MAKRPKPRPVDLSPTAENEDQMPPSPRKGQTRPKPRPTKKPARPKPNPRRAAKKPAAKKPAAKKPAAKKPAAKKQPDRTPLGVMTRLKRRKFTRSG